MGGRAISAVEGRGRRVSTLESFPVPLWLAQQNRWVEDPKNSDSAAYNYPLLLRIRGPLNREALRSSLDEVVQRHATLRSVFELRHTVLTQIVLPEHACPFEIVDLTSLEEWERETKVQEVVDREIRRPFCFADEIPIRATLFCLSSDGYELLIVTHHLVYDDWSNGVLVRDLSAIYTAFVAGQASSLPDLPVQYGDFVRWSRRRAAAQELAPQFAFWKEQLGDGATFHHLPVDFGSPDVLPPPAARANGRRGIKLLQQRPELKRGAQEKAIINEPLTRALADWSRSQYASLFMVLMAGFQCLLHRYSGDKDIAVGTCVANRPQVELENLIGRFGNHLIIRTDMTGNPSFQEVAERVRESALAAYGAQEVPFGEVLQTIRGTAGARCDRVVQAMFVFQNAPKGAWDIPALDVRWTPVPQATTKYDLTVWLRKAVGIEITLEYNADLFRASTIQRVLADYRGILETMVAHPSQQIDQRNANARKPHQEPAVSSAGRITPKSPVEPGGFSPQRDRRRPGRNGNPIRQGFARAKAPDEIEDGIARIWSELLNASGASHESPSRIPVSAEFVARNYFELGGDSLSAAQMLAQIEKRFGVRIPLALLLQEPTIERLAQIVHEQGSSISWQALVPIRTQGTRVPLFLFHGAGGNVLMYRDLARHLRADQLLYGLQCQGLDEQSPLLTSIEDMAAAYLREIRLVQNAGPYFLGGYCMGGTIAYEVAQQLHAMGEEVALLAMMDTPNWAALPKESVRAQLFFEFEKIAMRSRRFLQRDIRANLKCFQGRVETPSAASQSAGAKSNDPREKNGVKGQDELDFLRRLWDVNEHAALAYEPRTYAGRIVQFRPAWQYARYRKAEQSWADLAQGGIDVHELPVHPGEMLDEPLVQRLATELEALTRAAIGTAKATESKIPPSKGSARLER